VEPDDPLRAGGLAQGAELVLLLEVRRQGARRLVLALERGDERLRPGRLRAAGGRGDEQKDGREKKGCGPNPRNEESSRRKARRPAAALGLVRF